MNRRTFFSLSCLGGLFGRPDRSPAATLEPQRLRSYCPPKLRVWSLGENTTKEEKDYLVQALSSWDGHSELEVVLDHPVSVQQFDLTGPQRSIDAVITGKVDVKTEQVDGKLVAHVILEEPLVKVIHRD